MATKSNPKTTKTTNHKAKATKKAKRIPYYTKPEGMTLEEWQVALRKQAAHDEAFAITTVSEKNEPGVYNVSNPKTRQSYKVVYRGARSPWNYCSCMDFKTSQLGTCKHLEAVKLWLHGGRKVHREIPPYTSVYVDYRDGRKVKIRIGSDHKEEFQALTKTYFDKDGTIKGTAYDRFPDFLRKARAIDDTFRCYNDAMDLVLQHRDDLSRQRIISHYTDDDLDHILTTRLYPYQKEGVRFAFVKGKSIIADEMGLGKTIQAIATAELLRREHLIDSILILCPTSLKYQWKTEIERFTHERAHVIEGDPLKRFPQYNAEEPYKIISYNSVSNDIKLHGSLQADLLIMDEVQRLKNWETQISRSARKIDSRYSVILSGTPLENKMEELFSVMEFADQFLLGPLYKFRDQCEVQADNGQIIGYKNLNRIGRLVHQRLIRRRKRDVSIQMPERQDQNIFVPMTQEQMDCHDEYKSIVARLIYKWNHTHFLSEQDRKKLLTNLSKMRMVADSTFIIDQNEKQHYDTKVKEVMDIVDALMSEEGEKVVIFSQWERMTRLIAHELDRRQITYEYLHGSVPSRDRRNLVSNFTDKVESRVFLSTDAGSTGLNLQAAATLVNLDLPWNPAILEQRIARIYRLGQRRNIQVINLISKDTIEEQMISKLHFKTSMFEGVLDNGEDEIFLSDSNKFTKMMDSLTEMMDSEDKPTTDTVKAGDEEKDASTSPSNASPSQSDVSTPPTIEEGVVSPDSSGNQKESAPAQTDGTMTTTPSTHPHASNPQQLVADGISFLSGLSSTLSSPEATEALVNTIVKKDEATGQTTINIPVPDKDSVRNVLLMIGKLLGK